MWWSSQAKIRALEAKLTQAEAHIQGLEATQGLLVESALKWRGEVNELRAMLADKRKRLLQAQLDCARLADLVEEMQIERQGKALPPLFGIKIPEGM